MKKAQMKSWIIWLIMAAAFLVIIFVWVMPMIAGGAKGFSDMLKEGDFDGDNKENGFASDMMDPCPCGVDNVKQRAGLKEYCIMPTTDRSICDCANMLSNIAEQTYLKSKESSPNFVWQSDKCLYTKDSCTYLLSQNKEFMDQLLLGTGATAVTGCGTAVTK